MRRGEAADEFSWRRRKSGQRDTYCRPCRSTYGKEHYTANRQRYIDQAGAVKRRLQRERTLWPLEYFETHPCTDCGGTDSLVLEFDHLHGKEFDIAQGLARRAWDSLLGEIAKCEVVCANCHRRRTARRRDTVRFQLLQGK